jgi:protein-S-isoprenylcysteine O-methyltransferase Ste14
MHNSFNIVGWLACIVYSTIPAFWLMVHPFAHRWRLQRRSPYVILVPVWIALWCVMALATWPWRRWAVYSNEWTWVPAGMLFIAGFDLYLRASHNFSTRQLVGRPEIQGQTKNQYLVTSGIRSRIRHPIYLAHLCEMLAWSIGTGLAICWALTAFAIVTGALMVRLEDAELERRFGDDYRAYRAAVPAVIPKPEWRRQL